MMTPKEKAIAFVQSFIDEGFLPAAARIAALIAVDEILKYQSQLLKNYKVQLKNTYWEEVKKEIEKL